MFSDAENQSGLEVTGTSAASSVVLVMCLSMRLRISLLVDPVAVLGSSFRRKFEALVWNFSFWL